MFISYHSSAYKKRHLALTCVFGGARCVFCMSICFFVAVKILQSVVYVLDLVLFIQMA